MRSLSFAGSTYRSYSIHYMSALTIGTWGRQKGWIFLRSLVLWDCWKSTTVVDERFPTGEMLTVKGTPTYYLADFFSKKCAPPLIRPCGNTFTSEYIQCTNTVNRIWNHPLFTREANKSALNTFNPLPSSDHNIYEKDLNILQKYK